MTGVLIKRGNWDTETDTHREDVIRRHREKMAVYKPMPGIDPALITLRRNQHCQHLDFKLPASRAVR